MSDSSKSREARLGRLPSPPRFSSNSHSFVELDVMKAKTEDLQLDEMMTDAQKIKTLEQNIYNLHTSNVILRAKLQMTENQYCIRHKTDYSISKRVDRAPQHSVVVVMSNRTEDTDNSQAE